MVYLIPGSLKYPKLFSFKPNQIKMGEKEVAHIAWPGPDKKLHKLRINLDNLHGNFETVVIDGVTSMETPALATGDVDTSIIWTGLDNRLQSA